MTAAITARRYGLKVIVIDDQPAAGGQIWCSVEVTERRDAILGTSYSEGRQVAGAFRDSGAEYMPRAQLWQIEPGYQAYVTQGGRAKVVAAKAIILATGAQERPVPFPGWTLPGVLTVGAAQIMLKNAGQIPAKPVWIAGCGPLPLLYAIQLLRAGGKLAGYLDTTPPGQWRSALPYLPRALRALSDLIKGVGWNMALRMSNSLVVGGIVEIEASGKDRIESLCYRRKKGKLTTVDADCLLVHEGVVPNIHPPLALDCDVSWNDRQQCFTPIVDEWGESSRADLFIAGDGAGIAGAKAAEHRGEIAAIGVAKRLGRLSVDQAVLAARPIRRNLNREVAARPFLDTLFKPRPGVFAPRDDTIVCRCEEITAAEIRSLALEGRPGPNQVKAKTRMGMGPCQGRQCGYTLTGILAAEQNRTPSDIGLFRIRPPLKPVTLGELASLGEPAA